MIVDRVVDGLGAGIREAAGDQLRPLVEAFLSPVLATESVLEVMPEGWPAAFDIDGPVPQWLAQLVGVVADPSLTAAQQRAVIRSRAAWSLGTYRALIATLQSALIDERRVIIDERDAGAWHATIRVYESDYAPGTTRDTIRELAERHRPAGMTFDVEFFPSRSYAEAELDAATYAEAEMNDHTYADTEE